MKKKGCRLSRQCTTYNTRWGMMLEYALSMIWTNVLPRVTSSSLRNSVITGSRSWGKGHEETGALSAINRTLENSVRKHSYEL
jgi:hypothetical protein